MCIYWRKRRVENRYQLKYSIHWLHDKWIFTLSFHLSHSFYTHDTKVSLESCAFAFDMMENCHHPSPSFLSKVYDNDDLHTYNDGNMRQGFARLKWRRSNLQTWSLIILCESAESIKFWFLKQTPSSSRKLSKFASFKSFACNLGEEKNREAVDER